jgi:hypothetical protein
MAPLLRVPLQPHGGPVLVSARFEIASAEWASGFALGIDAGGTQASATINISGGGRHHFLRSRVWNIAHVEDRYLTLPEGPQTVLVRLAFTPWDRRFSVFLEFPQQGRSWHTSHVAEEVPDAEAWSLELAPPRLSPDAWMALDLHDLEVWGARVAPVSAAGHRASLALARGEPAEALRFLPPGDAMGRAVAALQMADLATAGAMLRRLDADGGLTPRANQLLRVRAQSWSRLVRSTLGPDRFAGLFAEVWRSAYQQEEGAQRAFIEDLEGLDLSRHPELGVRRALSLLYAGQVRRGTEAAEAWLASDAAATPELADLASELHRRLAVEAAGRGDGEAAREHAGRSVEVARWPAVARDRLQVEPALAGIDLPR